ncbi:MAG: SMP-30/gluconolactonase/LRE family protein [Betaproteobacteria bacterium]|nr:SMP-30/gluconolactonase/LRE family protein [Betaproteobacteria bacterium]
MFSLAPPRVRDLEVFTRLPDRYREPRVTSWSRANRGGAAIDSFLEAPVFDDDGNLFVGDIPNGRIFRIAPSGEWDLVLQYDGEPNGMKFAAKGEIVIADYRNGLVRLDVARGTVSTFLGHRNSESFKGLNDLVFDSRGSLYFTDQGQTGLHDPTGRVYRLGADGRLDVLLANVPSPNGVALSADGRVLFVAVTRGNAVWRVPLMEDGGVSKVGQFFTSHGPSGPDGLAVDEANRLVVANPGLGVAWVLDAMAQPVEVLRSPAGTSLTNLAFGGADRRTAFFTESTSGSILCATLEHAGARLSRPSGEIAHG